MDKSRLQQEELDSKADQPSDEVGDAELLGNKVLSSAKLKGKTFREAYRENKGYVPRMRGNVTAESIKYSSTMLQFRLYIEERDARKISRVMIEASRVKYQGMDRADLVDRLKQGIQRSHQDSEWTEVVNEAQAAAAANEAEAMAAVTAAEAQLNMAHLITQVQELDFTINKALEQRALLQQQVESMKKTP